MDTISLQVKDLSRFYRSTWIFFYRLNLTKRQAVSEILIVSDKNFLNDGKILSNNVRSEKLIYVVSSISRKK